MVTKTLQRGCRASLVAGLLLSLSCARPPREADVPPPAPTLAPACPTRTVTVPRLRFGVIRYGSTEYIHAGYEPVISYLQTRLGIPVDLVVVEHYDSLVAALDRHELDAGFLTPVAYVKAHEKDPCLMPLTTRVQDGLFHYNGYIVTRRDAGFSDLRQLAGRKIAFVAPSSASGYVFAMHRLITAGLQPDRDFGNILFMGDHSAVLRAVLERRADAGATWSKALEIEAHAGQDIGALQILGITGRIPNDVLVVRTDLDARLVDQIRSTMLGLNTMTSEGREALRLMFDVQGFVAVDDDFYEPVRSTLAQLRRTGVSFQ